jgi:hypothetical protein
VTDPSPREPVDLPHAEAVAVPVGTPATGTLARRHPVLVYTALRVAMLVAVGAVLYALSLRGVWLILFAFLVSGVVSAFVLRSPREGAVLGYRSAYRGINDRIDSSSRSEDQDDDLDDLDDLDGTPPVTS